MHHLTAERVGRLPLLIPLASEQITIVRSLDHETAELDAVMADGREAITLCRERRAARISTAVTGKIDVRGRA